MKKFIILILALLLMSCGGDDIGIDIGETTVSVSLKSTEPPPPDIMVTASDMFPVFDSITRAMEYHGVPYSDEPLFVWQTMTFVLNYGGEADGLSAPAELIGDYIAACFGGTAKIPSIAEGMTYNPESFIYTVPQVSGYNYDDYTVQVGDILDNGDGTFTAYINFNTVDGTIVNQYMFTLKKNPRVNAASRNNMMYSVVLAAELGL